MQKTKASTELNKNQQASNHLKTLSFNDNFQDNNKREINSTLDRLMLML